MALSKERCFQNVLYGHDLQLRFPPLCYPPLAKAARENDRDLLYELIVLGRDVDEEDSNGQTALHHAAEEGSIEAIVALLQAGADRTVKDERGFTPLHGAAYESQPGSAKCLLQHWDPTADVEKNKDRRLKLVNYSGTASRTTALHLASWKSSRETVLELLRGGANVHSPDVRNFVPIHFAASNRFDGPSLIQLLLEWGANVDSFNDEFYSPLIFAIVDCNVNAVRELLAASANVNAFHPHNRSALHISVQALNPSVAVSNYVFPRYRGKYLRKYSRIDYLLILKHILSVPSIRINYCDVNNFTALHFAAEADSFEGVKLLLEHGANPEIRNSKGKLPADLTKIGVIRSLLQNFKRGVHVVAYNDAQIQESPLVGILRKKATLINHQGSEMILQADSANSVKVVIPKNAISNEEILVLQVSVTPSPAILSVNLDHFQERQQSRALARLPKETKAMSDAVVTKIRRGEITLLEDASFNHLVMSSDPVDGDETVISPYVTITSSHCAEFDQRAQLKLPHCVKSVDKSGQEVKVNVKFQRLTSDGGSLTSWDNAPDEDVECDAETVTVQMDRVDDAVGVVAVAKSTSGEAVPKKVQLQILGNSQLQTNTEVYAVLSTNAYTADGYETFLRGKIGLVNLKEWMSLPEEIACSAVDIDVGMRAGEPAFFSPENRLVNKASLTSSDALHRVRFLLQCRSEPVRSIACHCVLNHGDGENYIPFATPEPAMSVKRLPEVEEKPSEKPSGIKDYVTTPMSKIKSIIGVDVAHEVAQYCSCKWEGIGTALGYSHAVIEDIISTSERLSNSSKLARIIGEWITDKGDEATVGELLNACNRVRMRGGVESQINSLLSQHSTPQ